MRRLVTLLVLVAVLAGAPAVGTAVDTSPTSTALTANNSTATPTPTPTNTTAGGGPSKASQVRITPIKFDETWLGVTVEESDETFTTRGPFALFSLSEPVESARITQQPATVTVLEGGHQLRVEYADDAAPPGQRSLFRLELFFADGSTKTVRIYARQTDVSVASGDLKAYAPVLEELKELAKAHGYGTSPEQLSKYLTFINERADLVEGFLTKKAAQLFALAIAAARNWLFWLLFLGGIALVSRWIQKRYGGLLEALQHDVGKAERKRRELELAYQEQKQTADESRLEEVPAVGSNAIYWEDAFGTRSPAQLARLAAYGAHRRGENGDLERVHNGVADLEAEELRDSWLEPVLRGSRIPTAKQALGELKSVCEWMETNHNLGHLYRNARDELERLIEELEERDQYTHGPDAAPGGGD